MYRYIPLLLFAALALPACSTTGADEGPAGTTSPTATTGTTIDGKGIESADKISSEGFAAAGLSEAFSADNTYACTESVLSGQPASCYCPGGKSRVAETAVSSTPVLWDTWVLSPRGAYAVTSSRSADPYTVSIYLACQ